MKGGKECKKDPYQVGLKQRDTQVGVLFLSQLFPKNRRGERMGGGGEDDWVICICVHEQMGGGSDYSDIDIAAG